MTKKFQLLATGLLLLLGACTQVKQGEVGVRITEVGTHAGVQARELTTGRYWPPIGTRIIVFPTTSQTVTWATPDDRIRFNNADGVPTEAPIAVTFHFVPDRADTLVQKYKLGLEGIVAGPLQREIQNAFVVHGTRYSSDALYGLGAQQLSADVKRHIEKALGPQGIVIESINWAGAAILPEAIVTRINEKTAEYQKADRAKAQVVTKQAEAQQAVAEAEGKARALDIEGNALRRNPEVLKLREIERWDGGCPLGARTCVTTPATPIVNTSETSTQ